MNKIGLKYPIVLVHGFLAKDSGSQNSWGGLPEYLRNKGNKVFFGNQKAMATIEENAQILTENIKKIAEENGGKVNIFAHSKGGLEARYAISCLGLDRYVASLTTFNTPHRGCEVIDSAMQKWSIHTQNFVYKLLNFITKHFFHEVGDSKKVLSQLRPGFCKKFNESVKDKKNVLYQSVSSIVRNYKPKHILFFPLQPMIRKYSRNNDGLITVKSEKWGKRCFIINKNKKISIAHDETVRFPKKENKSKTFILLNDFYIQLIDKMANAGL